MCTNNSRACNENRESRVPQFLAGAKQQKVAAIIQGATFNQSCITQSYIGQANCE
jgi:hypothetical protein